MGKRTLVVPVPFRPLSPFVKSAILNSTLMKFRIGGLNGSIICRGDDPLFQTKGFKR